MLEVNLIDLPNPIHVGGKESVQVLRIIRLFSPRFCANPT